MNLKQMSKKRPVFVVVGLQIGERTVSNDSINELLVESQTNSKPIKYIEVNLVDGDNSLECLHYLLWSKEMKELS